MIRQPRPDYRELHAFAGRTATPEIAERLRAWTDLPAELAGA